MSVVFLFRYSVVIATTKQQLPVWAFSGGLMLPFPLFLRQKVAYVIFQGLIYLCTKFHQNRLSSFGVHRTQTVNYIIYYIIVTKL
jgi:hypothetical protein